MLRPVLITAGLLGLLTGCSEPETPKDPWQSASTTALEQVLLPGYSRWADADRQLADSARAFCAGEQSLDSAREHYRNAHLAWSALQPLSAGPLAEGNLAWQVQFWPDKKNLVARQVKALLKKYPQLSIADLEKSSVVVQSLTAYEYLLFDPQLDLSDAGQKQRYCPLLIGIGSHQQALSTQVLTRWMAQKDGMASQLRNFPNARYADSHEAVTDLLRTQLTAVDSLKRKLGLPLGRDGQGLPQPYQAEAWRSNLSLEIIAATIDSARRLWHSGDGLGMYQLVPAADVELVKRIDAAWDDTRNRLTAMEQPMSLLLQSEEGRKTLNELYDSINRLHRLQESELAKVLGITLGFNANDGD